MKSRSWVSFLCVAAALASPAAADEFNAETGIGGIVNTIHEANRNASKANPPLPTTKSASAAPRPKPDVDLSRQWKDGSRNQGGVGSCHDFTAVGMVEAALYRAHGQQVHINENWLFLSSKIMHPTPGLDLFKGFKESGALALDAGGDVAMDVEYLFHPPTETAFPLTVEVSESQNADDREQFEELWHSYSDLELGTILPAAKIGIEDRLEKRVEDGDYSAANASLVCSEYSACALGQEGADAPPQLRDMKNVIVKQCAGKSVTGLMRNLSRAMAGQRFFKKEIATVVDDETMDYMVGIRTPGACSSSPRGRETLDAVSAELDAGRPVGVSIDLQGLPEWSPSRKSSYSGRDGHAVIIDGVKRSGKGGPSFLTRNSWGDSDMMSRAVDNPSISADELCHIEELYLVLGPGEAAPMTPGWRQISAVP